MKKLKVHIYSFTEFYQAYRRINTDSTQPLLENMREKVPIHFMSLVFSYYENQTKKLQKRKKIRD